MSRFGASLRGLFHRPKAPPMVVTDLDDRAAVEATRQTRLHLVDLRHERVHQASNTRNDQRELRRLIRTTGRDWLESAMTNRVDRERPK